MSTHQAPRKTPSQPNGVRTNNAGHAKKARSSRSNSTNKVPTMTASDGYAMGSYDNEPISETVATPSWMRSTPAEGANPQSPSSPVAGGPAYSSPLVPAAPSTGSSMIAPVPFHLHSFGQTSAPGGTMTTANNFGSLPAHGPMALNGMNSHLGVGPSPSTGNFGANPMAPAPFSQAYGPTSASAPPKPSSQDTIARILALQQANSSMSHSNSPQFSSASPTHIFPSSNPTMAGSASHPTPVGNPFSTPVSTMPIPQPVQSAPPGSIQPNLFPGVQTSPPKPTAATPISLDHLLPLQHHHHTQTQQQHQQQQQMDLKLWMDQFKMAQQVPSVPRAEGSSTHQHQHQHLPHHSHHQSHSFQFATQPSDSLHQLQQQFATGTGKAVQLTVSNEGHIKLTGPTAADVLFDPPSPSRSHLKTSGKNIPNPRTAPLHAHHNYGVPAQP